MKNNSKNKNSKRITDVQIYWSYLQDAVCTNTMASKELGMPQKNLCRFKRILEKSNLLFVVYKGKCKITGRQNVQYLTTNPELINEFSNRQFKLF